jgi:hypothetical protein
VIAFIGKEGAVIAGDMREILFHGEKEKREVLESELYRGDIISDDELMQRSHQLGISISIRDNKNKIYSRDGILIGEVSSFEEGTMRRRRVYAARARYAIIDIIGGERQLRQRGEGSAFVVLGNDITKQIAHECIKKYWKNGTLNDALRIIIRAMERASLKTASVSRTYALLQTSSEADPDVLIRNESVV